MYYNQLLHSLIEYATDNLIEYALAIHSLIKYALAIHSLIEYATDSLIKYALAIHSLNECCAATKRPYVKPAQTKIWYDA